MFWEKYVYLCAKKGESPNRVAKNLSIASGTVSEWKKGRAPQNATLKKIADYFCVPVDYFLSAPDGSGEDRKMSLDRESLITRIKELAESMGVSSTKAVQDSGAGKDFIANLKKGQSPSVEKVKIIADYFGVSVDYLLSGEQKEKTDGLPAGLLENPTKAEFIKLLPLLPDEDIEYLLKVAKAILEKSKK